jgi:hypothetical protein
MADIPLPTSENGALTANSATRPPQDRTDEPDEQRPNDELAEPITNVPSGEVNTALFPSHQCEKLENEWRTIQTNFVDSPREAVQKADALVTKTIDTLAGSFGDMRASLERTWEKNGEVSTEELRLALQNYRSFFRRLLSI